MFDNISTKEYLVHKWVIVTYMLTSDLMYQEFFDLQIIVQIKSADPVSSSGGLWNVRQYCSLWSIVIYIM